MEDVAAPWLVGLNDLAAAKLVAELAQRVEQATCIASDAAGVLSGAAVERDSQPTVP